jgi:hypothetical protein
MHAVGQSDVNGVDVAARQAPVELLLAVTPLDGIFPPELSELLRISGDQRRELGVAGMGEGGKDRGLGNVSQPGDGIANTGPVGDHGDLLSGASGGNRRARATWTPAGAAIG